MKKNTALFSLFATLFTSAAFSQDFNFNILPTAINPAFTGLFDGKLRATALFKNQWSASKPSFIAYGASVDATIAPKKSGYFALGIAFLDGRTSDNSFKNFSSFGSLAYHKTIVGKKKKADARRGDLAAGIQLGYIQRNISIAEFSNSFLPNVFRIGAGAQYVVLNVGLSFSQSLAPNFSYTVGLSGNNLNLLDDGTANIQHPLLRITPSYTGLLTANWIITNRLGVRPAALHLIGTTFYVFGNEFRYKTNNADPPNTIFMSIWYRSSEIITANLGYEFNDFRIGGGFDYYLLSEHAPGNGGIQVIARYIMPRRKK